MSPSWKRDGHRTSAAERGSVRLGFKKIKAFESSTALQPRFTPLRTLFLKAKNEHNFELLSISAHGKLCTTFGDDWRGSRSSIDCCRRDVIMMLLLVDSSLILYVHL